MTITSLAPASKPDSWCATAASRVAGTPYFWAAPENSEAYGVEPATVPEPATPVGVTAAVSGSTRRMCVGVS